jgi:hypothetical protein
MQKVKNRKWNKAIKLSLKTLLSCPDMLLQEQKGDIETAYKKGYRWLDAAKGVFVR